MSGTGRTPEKMWELLAKALVERNDVFISTNGEQGIDLRFINIFGQDEYVELPLGHPESYAVYVREKFFKFFVHMGNGYFTLSGVV